MRNVLMSLVAALALAVSGPCLGQQLQPPSAELQSFIAQLGRVYIARNGLDFNTFARQYPHALAGMIGHALWQQERYAGQDPQLGASLEKLKGEIAVYFGNLTQYCNYMDAYGNPVSVESLWNAAAGCMGPQGDETAFQYFGVRNGEMPNVLASAQPDSGQAGGVYGKLHEENAIELLGIEASGSSHSGITPTAADVDPSSKYLDKDTIVGVWEETDEYNQEPPSFVIVIQKTIEDGKDVYIGYCGNVRHPALFGKRYQFSEGTMLFKVKYDTAVVNSANAEECPLSYEGEGLGLTSYNQGPWKWIEKGEIRVWKTANGFRLGICYAWPDRYSGFSKVGQ